MTSDSHFRMVLNMRDVFLICCINIMFKIIHACVCPQGSYCINDGNKNYCQPCHNGIIERPKSSFKSCLTCLMVCKNNGSIIGGCCDMDHQYRTRHFNDSCSLPMCFGAVTGIANIIKNEGSTVTAQQTTESIQRSSSSPKIVSTEELGQIVATIQSQVSSIKTENIMILSGVAGCAMLITVNITLLVLYRKGKLQRFCRKRDGSLLSEETHFSDSDLQYDNLPRETCDSISHTGVANISHQASGFINLCRERQQPCLTCQDANQTSSFEIEASSRYILKSNSLPPPNRNRGRNVAGIHRSNTFSCDQSIQVDDLNLTGTGLSSSVYTLDRAFVDLSDHLCGIQWQMFFRRLIGSGSDVILRRVSHNHERDIREQIYQVLLEWKSMVAKEATLDVIVKELEEFGENELAEAYRKKLC